MIIKQIYLKKIVNKSVSLLNKWLIIKKNSNNFNKIHKKMK